LEQKQKEPTMKNHKRKCSDLFMEIQILQYKLEKITRKAAKLNVAGLIDNLQQADTHLAKANTNLDDEQER
jgi:hypothetical protein